MTPGYVQPCVPSAMQHQGVQFYWSPGLGITSMCTPQGWGLAGCKGGDEAEGGCWAEEGTNTALLKVGYLPHVHLQLPHSDLVEMVTWTPNTLLGWGTPG